MSDSKPCVRCDNGIPGSARFCTHCSSYQNWRRHLGFSSTFLALMIAAISVVTSFYNVIGDRIWPPASNIEVQFSDFGEGALRMIAINRGESSGFIVGASLTSAQEGGKYPIPAGVGFELADQALEVPQGLTRFQILTSFNGPAISNIDTLASVLEIPSESVQQALDQQYIPWLGERFFDGGSAFTGLDQMYEERYAVRLTIMDSDGSTRDESVPVQSYVLVDGLEAAIKRCEGLTSLSFSESTLTSCTWPEILRDQEY